MERLRKDGKGRYNRGMEFQAKRATAAQAEILGRIHAESWQAAYRGIVPETEIRKFSPEWRAKVWSEFLPECRQECYLFFCGEQPYGLAILARSHEQGAAEDEGEVYAFYTHPSVWGTPAVKRAFLFCLQRLKDMGHKTAIIWVLAENQRARRFYEKHGFHAEHREQWIEIGKPFKEVRYAKAL